MIASCFSPISTPSSISPKRKIITKDLSTCYTKTRAFFHPHLCWFSLKCGRIWWEYKDRSKLSAFASSNGNWVEVKACEATEYKNDEFIVVNFYRFVFIEDPQYEVTRHLSFMEGRDIHGRIYLNRQGINAQYSGPSKDALAYVNWVKEDDRFSDILVQISPAPDGHAFPRLKLRSKPSLVQVEGEISDLPLLDPLVRATPLTPSQWKCRLEAVNEIDNSSTGTNKRCILLDVRNGIYL